MKTHKDEPNIPSFDDMVFEGRNKEYGAYTIRKKYNTTLVWAILAGVIIAGVVVITPYVNAIRNPKVFIAEEKPYYAPPETFDPSLIPETPELPQKENVEVPKDVYRVPIVVDTILDEKGPQLLTGQEAAELPQDSNIIEINYQPAIEIDDPNEKKVEEPEWLVDEDPMFGNGDKNDFRLWVLSKVNYPEEAIQNLIQGKVYVQFVIEKNGRVTNVKVTRPLDPLIDQEVIRVVQSSPSWKPAKKQGNIVRMWVTIPIVFKLNEQ